MAKNKKENVVEFSTSIYESNYKGSQPMSDEQHKYKAHLLSRMYYAYYNRERQWKEFNDLTYIQRYLKNQEVSIAYNKARINPDDTEIVSGTTHQKIIALAGILLSYNYDAKYIGYDKNNNQLLQLGQLMTDIKNKTLELEKDDEKEILELLEYLQQGDVFTEEVFVEPIEVIKKFKGKVTDPDFDWITYKKKTLGYVERNILSGINVFLGNVREFFMYKQPYVFTVDLISYEEAKSVYGDMENFQYVPESVMPFNSSITFRDKNGTYALFSNQIQKGLVEVVKYQDQFNNEYQVFLNGIMMLPVKEKDGHVEGFPLTYISPSGRYTLIKGSGEPLSPKFAYSKGMAENMRYLQELKDETMRAAVLRNQQSYNPGRANLTGKELGVNINSPGIILDGLDPTLIPKLLEDNDGITAAQINFMKIVDEMINDQSVANIMEGQTTPGDQTKYEIQSQQKQSIIKVGIYQIGWTHLKIQQAWLRLYNILANLTMPIDKAKNQFTDEIEKKYRIFTLNTSLENGRKGIKIIRFKPANKFLDEKALIASEELRKRANGGTDFRIFELDPDNLRECIEWFWEISCEPEAKDSSELRQANFMQAIKDLMAIQPLAMRINMDYLGEKIAINNELDPDKLFTPAQAQLPQGQPQQGTPQGQNPMIQEMQQQAGTQQAGQPAVA